MLSFSGEVEGDSDDNEDLVNEIKELQACAQDLNTPTVAPEEDFLEVFDEFQVLKLFSARITAAPATAHNVLVLNKINVCILKHMEMLIKKKLDEIELIYDETSTKIKNAQKNKERCTDSKGSFPKCGMPFLKTLDGFSHKKNLYRIRYEREGFIVPEIYFSAPVCWNSSKSRLLSKVVLRAWKEKCEKKQEVKIRRITRAGADKDELSEASVHLKAIKDGRSSCLVNIEELDWWEIAGIVGECSAASCKAQWKYNCCPDLNQAQWTSREINCLNELVNKYGCQDWDEIGRKLDTKRSGLQCCIKYMRHTKRAKVWTAADDLKLTGLYERNKSCARPNIRIAYYFNEIPLAELKCRINNLQSLSKNVNMKNIFQLECGDRAVSYDKCSAIEKTKSILEMTYSEEEDRLLIEATEEYMFDWDRIANEIPGRKASSLKKRYQHLKKFGKNVLDVFSRDQEKSPLLPQNPVDVLSVLRLMWDGKTEARGSSRYGLNFGIDQITIAGSQLCKHLQFGHVHLFGPRFPLPRTDEAQKENTIIFSAVAQFLSIEYKLSDLIAKVKALNLGSPERNVAHMCDVGANELPELNGYCFLPPNALTLVGLRTLACSRGLLTGQSLLPIMPQATQIDASISDSDRISVARARELFKNRVFSLFFLSHCMSKIPQEAGRYNSFLEESKDKLHKTRAPRKSAHKIKKSRKIMAQRMNKIRWNLD